MNTTDNSVATKTKAVLAMEPAWQLATALMAGTAAMRAAGMSYLPMWPKEENLAYNTRLSVSTLFPAYQRTAETLAAKPVSKPLTLPENINEQIEEWAEDIDLQGRTLDDFTASIVLETLSHGLTGILVEFQTVKREPDAPPMSQEDEKRMGLRPYFVHIHPEQLIGWRAERQNGTWVFTQLRLMERVVEPDGAFGESEVEQVRVLTPGAWATYRKEKNQATGTEEWVKKDEGVTSLKRIPFVPAYGKRTGFMLAKPPMLELAHLNVKHWQSQSDQDTLLHIARVPILAMTGVNDENFVLTLGSSTAIKLPGESANLFFVEHSGQAIGAGKTALDDLKDEMQQAGAELLVLASRGPATATEVAQDNAVGMCHLQKVTIGVQGAINEALDIMAEYVNVEKGDEVKLFSDFGAATLADASAQLLSSMASAGQLSNETLFNEMQRRGTIASDLSWEDEQEKIDAQGPPLGMAEPTAPTGAKQGEKE